MGKLSNIIPVSDLRQDAAKLLKIGADAYEQSERQKEILRLIAKGEREIETGEGDDLDTILAEADALLAKADNSSNNHSMKKSVPA